MTGALEYLVKAYKLAEAKAKEEHKEVDMLPPEATVAQFFWQTGDQDNAKKWMIVMLQRTAEEHQRSPACHTMGIGNGATGRGGETGERRPAA